MRPTIIHVAAQAVGEVQRCARCGAVLLDYRGAQTLASTAPGVRFWWSGNVAVGDGEEGETTDPPTCRPAGH